MCIVIDMDVFAKIFKTSSQEHHKFKPVYDWIRRGPGKIIYGGSTYLKQLKKSESYLDIIEEYSILNKTFVLCKECVDIKEEETIKIINDTSFDDAHIAAILMVSSCRLVCCEDVNAKKFIKHIFKGSHFHPKFYAGHRTGCNRILDRSNIPHQIKKCIGLCANKTNNN